MLDKKAQVKEPILEEDNVRIGLQIRDLRKAKGLTLQELADQIGRSVGYLSQVERGVSILPIPVLQQISLQLGVQITWFFHSETQQPIEELGHVVRKSNRRQLSYSGTGMHEEMLSPGLSGDLLMIQTTLEPNAESDSQPRKRSGEEAGLVLQGELLLTIGEQTFELAKEDSFSIAKDESYHIKNPSSTMPAVVLWVITPPIY